jgi:NDP-sugar pyrophosphorylase family protein
MQAVILAGGLGTRLRSVVSDKPKPMAEIKGKPFLEYQIEFLRRHKIGDVVLCVGYLHRVVQDYFRDGAPWGVRVKYAVEDELLGTAGAVKNAEKHLQERFVLLNGDSFFDFDLSALLQFHLAWRSEDRSAVGSIALTEVDDLSSYGAITIDARGKILSFEEKSGASKTAKHINAGVYVLEKEVLSFIPPMQKVSLERETFPALLQDGKALMGFSTRGFFADIGTPDGLHTFQHYVLEKPPL